MAKAKDAFRTISEVAEWLDTPTHVLRFWESKFSQIKPVKGAGGRRYYRPEDMDLLGGIKHLLHEQGMTIKGTQKLLREKGIKHVSALGQNMTESAEAAAAQMDVAEMDVAEEPASAPADELSPEQAASGAAEEQPGATAADEPDTASEEEPAQSALPFDVVPETTEEAEQAPAEEPTDEGRPAAPALRVVADNDAEPEEDEVSETDDEAPPAEPDKPFEIDLPPLPDALPDRPARLLGCAHIEIEEQLPQHAAIAPLLDRLEQLRDRMRAP